MSITEFSCPFLRRGKFPCVALAGSVALDQMAPARERLLLAAPPPPAWLTNAAVGLVVSATGVLRSTFESGPLGHCGCWVATAVLCTAVLLVLGWVCARVREGRLLAALPWWGETALCFALPHATGAMPMGWDPATGAFVALGLLCALLESSLLLRRRPRAAYMLHALNHLAHAYGKPLPLAPSELPLTFLRAGLNYALARHARARLAPWADALLATARHRRVLGLAASGAEDGTARRVWRRLTLETHPDKHLCNTGSATTAAADLGILKEARDALEALPSELQRAANRPWRRDDFAWLLGLVARVGCIETVA